MLASVLACDGSVDKFYSVTRVIHQLHNPSEVSTRNWETQISPRLLPWIYSVFRLKYAGPYKLIAFKNDCEGAKTLQQWKVIFAKEQKTPTLETSDLWRTKETHIHKNAF